VRYEYRQAPEGINNPPANHLGEALALAGGLAAIIVGVFLLLGWLANRLVDRISPETERRLAEMIRTPVGSGAERGGDAELQKVLADLTPRLPPLAYPLRIKVECSDQVNAMALPGGTIVLYAGLLSRIRSENELAMVIGHEAGHFAARDHLKVLGRSLVALAAWAFVFRGQDQVPSFLRNVVGITSNGFSRAQEEEADNVGARLVNAHYGHAGGIVDFFRTLEEEKSQSRAGAWFSTHPAHLTRIDTMETLIAREGWRIMDAVPLDGAELAERICETGGCSR
jgi:predicted Zn-dependent protease